MVKSSACWDFAIRGTPTFYQKRTGAETREDADILSQKSSALAAPA
jgi:hypothetical protein